MSMNEPPDIQRASHIDLDDGEFDSFARSAAASLRSAAPDNGAEAAIRRGNRQHTRRLAMELVVVIALVGAGVVVFSRSRSENHDVDTPPEPTTESTVSPIPTSIESAAEIQQWFLDYTGNPSGPATGAPVKFGVAMESFPYRYQLGSAVKYLNDHAGGVGGRPIELDVCIEALSVCADRFATDPSVVAVLENEWQAGKSSSAFSESIGTALRGRKPLHTTWGNGTPGVAYYPSYFETVWAMTLQAAKLTKPGAKVLVVNGTNEDYLSPDSPQLTSGLAGRDVVRVFASGSQPLADTIRRAGATDAAAVVLAAPPFSSTQIPSPHNGIVCDDLSAALEELRMHPAVVVETCEPHEGWYKLDTGFNETSPESQSGTSQIITAMPHLGDTVSGPATRDVREAGALLAVVRMINELGGPSKATPAALDQAMHDFTGPLPLAAGPLDCSPTGQLAERRRPGSCVRFVDVHQFVNGSWVDQPPIDLAS